MRRFPRLVVLAIAVPSLLLGACGEEAASYEDATSLAQALSAAGVPCDGLEPGAKATLVADSATCNSGDSRLSLYTFSSETNRDDWLKVGGRLGATAIGPDWVVTGDASTVEEAADAMEADLTSSD